MDKICQYCQMEYYHNLHNSYDWVTHPNYIFFTNATYISLKYRKSNYNNFISHNYICKNFNIFFTEYTCTDFIKYSIFFCSIMYFSLYLLLMYILIVLHSFFTN